MLLSLKFFPPSTYRRRQNLDSLLIGKQQELQEKASTIAELPQRVMTLKCLIIHSREVVSLSWRAEVVSQKGMCHINEEIPKLTQSLLRSTKLWRESRFQMSCHSIYPILRGYFEGVEHTKDNIIIPLYPTRKFSPVIDSRDFKSWRENRGFLLFAEIWYTSRNIPLISPK